MSNKKILITVGLVTTLLLSVTMICQADYWNDVSTIFSRASKGIGQLGNDATAMSQGTMSMSTGLEYAKDYQNQALNQLTEIVQLTPQAPNMNLHVRLVNVISAWYTTTELWRKGLAEYDTELIKGATQVMKYITRKTSRLRPKIQE